MSDFIIEHESPQRSPEWFAVRLGKISGSLLPKLMKAERAKSDWNETQLGVLQELASQILTGEREETFQSKAMEWGQEKEKEAMAFYMAQAGRVVRECGFFENLEYTGCGASPDGIIEGDGIENPQGVLEIKCPLSKTHMKYLDKPELLWKDYRWQVVGEVMITGSKYGELISFDPRFPGSKKMVRYIPGDLTADMEKLAERLREARVKIDEWIKD